MSAVTPAVDVDGWIYGCALLVEPALAAASHWLRDELRRLRIGHISDPALDERWAEFAERAAQAAILNRKGRRGSVYGRCAECATLESCGVCPVAIGLQAGNTDPDRIPDFPCAFAQVLSRTRERFLSATAGAARGEADGGTRRLPDLPERFRDRPEVRVAMKRIQAFCEAASRVTGRT